MVLIVILFIFLVASFIRYVRWLSLLQEKEYRWDRLKLLLFSPQGIRELIRVIPRITDFSRSGLKRPKITGRVLFICAMSCLFVLKWWLVGSSIFDLGASGSLQAPAAGTRFWLSWWGGFYVLMPLIVMLGSIPSSLISRIQTYLVLRKASRRLRQATPTVIGITGSYGKTSTKLLLAHLLQTKHAVFVTPKSFNTRYSVARNIEKEYRDQPIAILEYGAYAKGEIARLAQWFPPNVAIITGLAPQHMGLFGSVAAIILAKSELVAALPEAGVVLFNAVAKDVDKIVKTGQKSWRFRHPQAAPLTTILCDYHKSALGFEYGLNTDGNLTIEYHGKTYVTQLAGLHMAEPVEVAAVTARRFDLSPIEIATALASYETTGNFLQLQKTKSGAVVIDDGGTANPAGFSAAIALLLNAPQQKKTVITSGIVDLGTATQLVHQRLAQELASKKVVVLYVGEVGKTAFEAELGERCISDRASILKHLQSLSVSDALLIEGRMPGWIAPVLKDLR